MNQDFQSDSHPIYPIYYPEHGQKLDCYGSDGWKSLISGKLEEKTCFSRCYAATGNEPIKKYIKLVPRDWFTIPQMRMWYVSRGFFFDK